MAYFVKLNSKAQLEFVLRQMENWQSRIHANISAYVEYAELIDEIVEALRAPVESERTMAGAKVTSELVPPSEDRPLQTRRRKTPEPTPLPAYCPEHPKYEAKRSPRTDCQGCWDAYKRLNPTRYAQARRKFERAGS